MFVYKCAFLFLYVYVYLYIHCRWASWNTKTLWCTTKCLRYAWVLRFYAWVVQCYTMGQHSFMWNVTHAYGTWLVHMGRDSCIWDVTRAYGKWLVPMGHDSCIWDVTRAYGKWLVPMGRDSCIWDVTRAYGTWLVHMGRDSCIWDVTRAYGPYLICTRRQKAQTQANLLKAARDKSQNCALWFWFPKKNRRENRLIYSRLRARVKNCTLLLDKKRERVTMWEKKL